MSDVRIEKRDGKIYTITPYKDDFPQAAKAIGGKWKGKQIGWEFPEEIEARVRDLVIQHYGHDGTPQSTADVAIRVFDSWSAVGREYWRFGRKLLWRSGRDWPVSIDPSVIVLEGAFKSSGGSRKYPMISMKEESVLLKVEGVPISAIEQDDGEHEIIGIEEVRTFTVTLEESRIEHLRAAIGLSDEKIVSAALELYEIHCKEVKENYRES